MNSFVVKFLWLENYIGVSLDYMVNLKKVPMLKYYFWPKTDAWEDIKNELEKLDILPYEDFVLILNTITDVINYWQQNNKGLKKKSFSLAKSEFSSCFFVGYN